MKTVISIALIMIAVHGVNIISGGQLIHYGLLPRQITGLWGIFTSPWIHSDIAHLVSNLSAFIVLAWLCTLRSQQFFIVASCFIIILSGLLVWLFGRSAYHVGASCWIFGLWALLMANAYFDRTIKNMFLGLVVLVFYGGLIWGVLPSSRVSFEGHIAGIIAGIGFAWLMVRNHRLRALTLKRK